MAAEDRRELVLGAARAEFAARGLHGASTNAIAAEAGISQPYLFQLYATKRELFSAVVGRYFDGLQEQLEAATATAAEEDLFQALAAGYLPGLVGDREGLLLFLQALAACSDPEIQSLVRARFADIYHYVERVSGANDEAVRTLFAYSLLAALGAAVGLSESEARTNWGGRLMGFLESFER